MSTPLITPTSTRVQIEALTSVQISAFTATIVAGITATQIPWFSPNLFSFMPFFGSLSLLAIAAINNVQIRALKASQINQLTVTQIPALTNQVEYLSYSTTPYSSEYTLSTSLKVVTSITPINQIIILTKAQLNALTVSPVNQIGYFKIEQLLPTQIPFILPAQIPAINYKNFKDFTENQIKALLPTQIGALLPAQFISINALKISLLTSAQIKAIPNECIKVITGSQVQNLSKTQITFLNVVQIPQFGMDVYYTAEEEDCWNFDPYDEDYPNFCVEVEDRDSGFLYLSLEQLNALTKIQFDALNTVQLFVGVRFFDDLIFYGDIELNNFTKFLKTASTFRIQLIFLSIFSRDFGMKAVQNNSSLNSMAAGDIENSEIGTTEVKQRSLSAKSLKNSSLSNLQNRVSDFLKKNPK